MLAQTNIFTWISENIFSFVVLIGDYRLAYGHIVINLSNWNADHLVNIYFALPRAEG